MTEKPIISIIIPCYNSGSFLTETITNLESVDLDDCEVVLIDDGSTDDTLHIMQALKTVYPNIIIISQENKGVSIARNVGIDAAQGKYIYFLDSDDMLAENAMFCFKNTIMCHPDCDILAFGYKMLQENGKERFFINAKYDCAVIRGVDAADLFYKGMLFLNVCSILIKKEFITNNNLKFQEGIKIGEDYDFLRKAVLHTNFIYYQQTVCFIYKLRKGSATNGHKGYGIDNYRSLLLSFECAKEASNVLSIKTVNYYKAARYSAHLRAYLKSSFKSSEINDFFYKNQSVLYLPMSDGRRKVMLAIKLFRLLPIKIVLKILK